MSSTGSGSGYGGGGGSAPLPERIDHYTIGRRIGRGGQGDVYLAHDPNLDIDVALKVLHSDYRSEEFVDRFKVEARTAVRLTAPNIVRVYNFNPAYPYLVMEYCGDGDLNRLIKSRPRMPLRRSLNLIRQICEGLAVAHDHEPPILHRDLKPGNVLFNRDVPKVADFGLAKVLTGATSGLTTTRGMMGTVGYSSPEQLRDASSVDHRADLWSVGVMLYEILTYTRPFEKPGDDYVNVAIRVRTEPPAPPRFELPAPVKAVIDRALAKEAQNRFSSAREMIAAIDEALAAVPNPDELLLPPEDAMDELDRLAAEAASVLSSGLADEADTLVQRMRALSTEHSLPRYWLKQVRAVREESSVGDSSGSADSVAQFKARRLEARLDSIRAMIARREYRDARRQVAELMMEDPDNVLVHEYLERITREETEITSALNAAHEEAQQARQSGDLEAVLRVWRAVDERFPDHDDVRAELAVAERELELARRGERRAGVEARAHERVEAGDLAGAAEIWQGYLAEYPDDAEAAAARREILERKLREERARRVAQADAESAVLVREGKRAEALVLWEGVLRDDPGIGEAFERVETLRREIAAEKQAARVARARAESAERVAASDLTGALAAWESLLAEIPGEPEGVRQAERLRKEIAKRRRAARAGRLRDLAAAVEARVRQGRYASRPETGPGLATAVQAALGAADDPSADPDAAAGVLQTAAAHAERDLLAALAPRRAELRARMAEAGEALAAGDGSDASSEEADSGALDAALDAAAAALCRTWPADAPGDPIDDVNRAVDGLDQAIARLGEDRRAAIERARAAATAAREQLDAAESVTARWEALRELERWTVEAFRAARHEPGAGLDRLAREAVGRLGALPDDGLEGEWTERVRSATRAAAGEAAARRERAGERWERAERAWEDVASGAGDETRAEAGATRERGRAAVDEGHPEDADARARHLESLTARVRTEQSWFAQREAVLEVEGAPASDGALAPPDDPATGKLLGRYREAMARSDLDAAAAVHRDLVKVAAGGRRGRARKEKAGAVAIPPVGARERKTNRRLQPEVLAAFDRALEKFARNRDARAGAEAKRARERLVPPPPLWSTLAPLGGAVLVLAVAVWAVLPRGGAAGPVSVSVISAAGTTRVAELQRDGRTQPLPGPAEVTEEGARWRLAPGEYVLRTEAGGTFRFRVPEEQTILVGNEGGDFAPALMRELGLDVSEGAGTASGSGDR